MRLIQLDIFRGLACLMVLLFHYTSRYAVAFDTRITTQLFDIKHGGLGVDLFFIISGFVIFMSISKNKSPFQFLIKRFIRLYPTFWICVIITFCVIYLSDLDQYKRTPLELFLNLTMVPDALGARRVDGAYWSLLPELLFYFMCFLLLYFNKIKNTTTVCLIWLMLIVLNHFIDTMPIRILFNLKFGHLFIIGIHFYKIMFYQNKLTNHLFIFLSFLCSLLINTNPEKSVFLIGFITLFYLLVYGKLNWLKSKALSKLGEISYPLYLVHQFIGFVVINRLISMKLTEPTLLILIPLTITVFISIIVTYYLEPPFRKIIKRGLLR